MHKHVTFFIKTAVFFILLYIIMQILAFVLKNDSDSYCRILFHELHTQETIDTLICGASHVSHGLYPDMADAITGKKHFCAGTPGQAIDGTYAIIREAAAIHNIKQIFLELDFAVAIKEAFKERKGLKNTYLVSEYLKIPSIKFDYLLHASSPAFYLNTILPIGSEKYIEADPHTIIKNMKSKLSGEYFKYSIASAKNYAGKGCVLEPDFIENGTFWSAVETPIPMENITDDYKNTVKKIADFCKQKKIELILFSMPGTDFYLTQKGNYDEYLSFLNDFAASIGYDYFDFNLCKDTSLHLEDKDYQDDNHFSKNGVIKFTQAFCDFFYGSIPKDDFFYKTYAEKTAAQESKIYGLMIDESIEKNKCQVKIIPVMNHGSKSNITYDIYLHIGENDYIIQEDSPADIFYYPENTSGTVEIISYCNGTQHNHIKKYFNSL